MFRVAGNKGELQNRRVCGREHDRVTPSYAIVLIRKICKKHVRIYTYMPRSTSHHGLDSLMGRLY